MTRRNTPDPAAGYGVRPPPSGVQPIGSPHPQFPHLVRVANRSRLAAALLALFVGWIGVHRFYLGRNGSGVAYLLLFWTGIPAMIAVVECILFAVASERDFDLKYNYAPGMSWNGL